MHVGSCPNPSLPVLSQCEYCAWHVGDVGEKIMLVVEHIQSILVGSYP